ncbi:MAG: hypothetical protein JWO77_267 [Ilumatobacteraceae bacterium]|nr:hypothetical protein [Ilumatobacteraceae bacterium]
MRTATPSRTGDEGSSRRDGVDLAWVVAACSAGAALIHIAMISVHRSTGWVDPVAFALVGGFQLAVAAILVADQASRRLYQLTITVNLAAVGAWVLSRTVGLPVGGHAGSVEEVGFVDLTCAGLELAVIAISARLLLAGAQRVRLPAAAFAVVAALGVAAAASFSPGAATHGDHGGAAGHHGAASGESEAEHQARMARLDDQRCDRDLNIPAYWDEAERAGVDVYDGGEMPTGDDMGHAHGAAATSTSTTAPTVTGDAVLDALVARTGRSLVNEGAPVELVEELGRADDATYDAWVDWLRTTGALSHDHAVGDPAGDGSGPGGFVHSGHLGPQPWVAITDPARCAQLAADIEQARAVAARYPTAADALAAGYDSSTPYVGAIAAHFVKFPLVDGHFDLEQPEMLLYDGNGPDAHLVGLSYFVMKDGAEPETGFAGVEDRSHRHHLPLCEKGDGVIGPLTISDADCAAQGGTRGDGSRGWMMHAWVVPGCESPWGVFSGSNPILEGGLGDAAGSDDGHCAGSKVRSRYGLDELPAASAAD